MTGHRDAILDGLAANPAAPTAVLLRLPAEDAAGARRILCLRDLPADFVDAMIRHPSPKVRLILAHNIGVDPGQRARLVDDPDPVVRRALAVGPDWFRRPAAPLPEWAQRRLLTDTHAGVRKAAAHSDLTDGRLTAELADDPSPDLRSAAAAQWEHLAPRTRERLLADPDPSVRRQATWVGSLAHPELTDLVLQSELTGHARSTYLARAALSPETARQLAAGGEPDRMAIASNPTTPLDIVRELIQDPSHDLRMSAACHPGLSEAERAAVDFEVKQTDKPDPADWATRTEDLDALRACATSVHTLLRRAACYNPHLPLDAVEVLAHDDDHIVRLLLCENQPTVPGEVLLQTYLECEYVTAGDLLRHPDFPHAGNAKRFAGHPDRTRRHLAALDPEISGPEVAILAEDPAVRRTAIRHPNLPGAALAAYFAAPDTRPAAVRNPCLPSELMHRALDELGLP